MLYTTLNILRKGGVCAPGYRKLCESLPEGFGPDEPIPLLHVLFSNGLADCVYALRLVHPECIEERDKIARLFACACAERVLPLFEQRFPQDDRPRKAIEAARRYALGEISLAEMRTAARAADAAYSAAAYAAYSAAAYAAYAAYSAAAYAAYAANAAARAAARAAAYAASDAAAYAPDAYAPDAARAEREAQTQIMIDLLAGRGA